MKASGLLASVLMLSSAHSCMSPPTPAVDRAQLKELTATTCELVRTPVGFNRKRITVTGTIRTTAHHGLVFHGADCGNQTVALLIPTSLDGQLEVEELRRTVFRGYPRTQRDVNAVLSGDFEWRPGEVPSRVFMLARVISFEGA
jgi:hypothetical protein